MTHQYYLVYEPNQVTDKTTICYVSATNSKADTLAVKFLAELALKNNHFYFAIDCRGSSDFVYRMKCEICPECPALAPMAYYTAWVAASLIIQGHADVLRNPNWKPSKRDLEAHGLLGTSLAKRLLPTQNENKPK